MSSNELKKIISECCNDIVFTYNGLKAGVTSEVHESVPTFSAWYGDKIKTYRDINELFFDKFFGGKSIADLANRVDFSFV